MYHKHSEIKHCHSTGACVQRTAMQHHVIRLHLVCGPITMCLSGGNPPSSGTRGVGCKEIIHDCATSAVVCVEQTLNPQTETHFTPKTPRAPHTTPSPGPVTPRPSRLASDPLLSGVSPHQTADSSHVVRVWLINLTLPCCWLALVLPTPQPPPPPPPLLVLAPPPSPLPGWPLTPCCLV